MKRLRWWSFGLLAWLDVALYVETALRWQEGLSFVGGWRWLAWTVPCVGGWLLAVAWLTFTGAGVIRHAGLAFLAASWGFFIAGTGHPTYDWRALPFYAGLFEDGSITRYISDGGGFDLACVVALVHGTIGGCVKAPQRTLAPWSLERWLLAVGLSVCLAGLALGSLPIHEMANQPPAREVVEAARRGLGSAHVIGGALLAAVSFAVSLYRFVWLRSVRRGLVPGYRIDRVGVKEPQRLAKLFPLPRRWLKDVLFRVTSAGVEPLGLLPAAWGGDSVQRTDGPGVHSKQTGIG